MKKGQTTFEYVLADTILIETFIVGEEYQRFLKELKKQWGRGIN